MYKGADLYNGYDTRQVFGANDCALHSVLPPFTIYGQYVTRSEHAKRATKELRQKILNFAKSAKRTFFLLGLAVGFGINAINASEPEANKPIETSAANEPEVETETQDDSGRSALATIRITAFIRQQHSFEYYFWDDETNDSWNPSAEGFSVRYVDECTALLVSNNESFQLTCKSSQITPNAHQFTLNHPHVTSKSYLYYPKPHQITSTSPSYHHKSHHIIQNHSKSPANHP